MFRVKSAAIAAAMVLTSALGAAASTVSFDLGAQPTSSASDTSLEFTSGGLTMTVTGSFFWFPSAIGDTLIKVGDTTVSRQNDYGLWVGDHLIDGNGSAANDIAILTFSEAVSLSSISISYADADDDYNLFALVDGEMKLIMRGDAANAGANNAASLSTIDLASLTSTVFGFGVRDNGDEYKLRVVTVDVPAVPLPAAGLMLLTGLGGLGLTRHIRRKRG